MDGNIKIMRVKGAGVIPYIPELAKLRIEIFHAYPYLYVGDIENEEKYLQTYVQCSESVAVLALHHGQVIGASTAIPLEFETIEVQKPFLERDIAIKTVFYFGESVLKPDYRGQGVYRHFFTEREVAAKEYGCQTAAFAAVEREMNDPRKPKDYVPLDTVWKHFGYVKHPELCTHFEWKEIGEASRSKKPLIFWLKNL